MQYLQVTRLLNAQVGKGAGSPDRPGPSAQPNGKVLEYAWVSGARGIRHTDSVGPRKSPPYSFQLTTFDNVFGIYCSAVRNSGNASVLDSHAAGYKC